MCRTRLLSSSSGVTKEVALWLWEVHNSVNVRLMRERAERDGRSVTVEEIEAAKWSTSNMCLRCLALPSLTCVSSMVS